jgi:hypothetical protein
MKFIVFILFLFLTPTLVAQTSIAGKTSFNPALLEGTWIKTDVDSIFGHKSILKFSFTKAKTFEILIMLDNKLKEKYTGIFEIVDQDFIQLKIKNKPNQFFKIIQLSFSFLRLKVKNSDEILDLVRE